MTDTQLCAHDNCEQPSEGAYCPRHLLQRYKAERQIRRNGEKARKKLEKKLGTLDYLIVAARTSDDVAELDRNIQDYNAAFDQCLQHFWECNERGTKLTQRLNMDAARGVELSVKIVKASASDFCADFFLAARHTLRPTLFAMFDLVFVQRKYSQMPGDDYRRIRQQVGRWLVNSRVCRCATTFGQRI
jgi:hypothetical protein